MEKKQNYKRKNYYYKPQGGGSNWNNKKKFNKNYLQPGMRGFMCTCNAKFREKECVKESLNILNEYAEKLYGSDDAPIQHDSSKEDLEGAVGEDIADELKNEIKNFKSSQGAPGLFNVVDTNMPAVIFIQTTLEDPVKLAHTILSEAAVTKTQKARSLLRMVPVEVVCKAFLEDIKVVADSLFDKHFRCEPTTFAIIINKRYNDSILRDEVIQSLALLVTDKNNEHKANLSEPKRTILVEIFKGLCCLSVLEDYKPLRHYNIAELTKPEQKEQEKVDQGEVDTKIKEETGVDDNGGEDDKGEVGKNGGVDECEKEDQGEVDSKSNIAELARPEQNELQKKLDKGEVDSKIREEIGVDDNGRDYEKSEAEKNGGGDV